MDSTITSHGHDTHAIPPQAVCNAYKKYQKMEDEAVNKDLYILDFSRGLTNAQKEKLVAVDNVPSELIAFAWKAFKGDVERDATHGVDSTSLPEPCTIYEHKDFPGLRLLPSLLPPEVQVLVVSSLLHRDLANLQHKTNIHHDYTIPYAPPTSSSSHQRESFFTLPPHAKNQMLTPLNPVSNHKPLNMTQFLVKKLRWLTLGSQYDWTTRSYDKEKAMPFPVDIGKLVKGLFRSAFEPESGVVLIYGAKDYMPVHRDVSEECERGLASFSLGCDGLFILSREKYGHNGEDRNQDERKLDENREMETLVLRVRSGDCVWMGGETRWCWHAMPKVMAGTCPEWLEGWPVETSDNVNGRKEYEKWKGFMKGKRINISCRQVWG
ncbi:hypothetical protein N431DRAFT_496254 [Stipitochalara longipes BDJ]|nr:hypothetical protein N431DRAFT_496254 [Stipitochalara longipes BDJ]